MGFHSLVSIHVSRLNHSSACHVCTYHLYLFRYILRMYLLGRYLGGCVVHTSGIPSPLTSLHLILLPLTTLPDIPPSHPFPDISSHTPPLTPLSSHPSPHTPSLTSLPLTPLPLHPSPHTPPLTPLPLHPSPHTPPLTPLSSHPSPHIHSIHTLPSHHFHKASTEVSPIDTYFP